MNCIYVYKAEPNLFGSGHYGRKTITYNHIYKFLCGLVKDYEYSEILSVYNKKIKFGILSIIVDAIIKQNKIG